MSRSVSHFLHVMTGVRFPLNSEAALKTKMTELMTQHEILFKREFALNKKDRPDFMIDSYAIEVKIKGGAIAIYKQCERYAMCEGVKGVVLITNKAIGWPSFIAGKPTYVFDLGRAWL